MKTNIVMLVTGLGILLLINLSIWQKQLHLKQGEEIYLELAPVDPRSLMQGDYMALRYALSSSLHSALHQDNELDLVKASKIESIDGFVVVEKDENQVARFVRIKNAEPISAAQRTIQFRLRNGRIKFASNAFFFEEGDEPLYRNARYGAFRLNKKGEVLLTGLLDQDFHLLGKD